MPRQHPNPGMEIPVTLAIYQQLLGASASLQFKKEHWEIAAEAIDEWMRRHNPNGIPMPATKGYQWKRLFLPDGTLLRTVFDGKNHHSLVEGDQILYDGKAVSPSGFVNAVGGIRRNAWRCTWLLLPGEKVWKLADTLRTRERPRRERKPAGLPRNTTAMQSDVVRVAAHVPPVVDPNHVQSEPVAARTFNAPFSLSARVDKIQRPESNGDDLDWQRRTTSSLPPTRCRRGPERRAGGADWIMRSLREELLPLLHRITASDERQVAPAHSDRTGHMRPDHF